jgi:hypothetical protein
LGGPLSKLCVTPPFSIHFEWRAGLSDTLLKGDHPRTIPAKFALIWFSGFTGEDLNVIFYQNMSNLYNQYKSVEREYYEIKITSKSFAQKFELK